MHGLTSLATAGLIATALVAPPVQAQSPNAAALDHPPLSTGADFNLDGFPDVVTSIPGNRDGEGLPNDGAVRVIYGGGKGEVYITQDSPGVPDVGEAGDLFGQALTTWYSPYDDYPNLVVGAPGEAVGTQVAAGQITVFPGGPDGLSLNGYLYNQDSPGVPGVAETGDRFGWSLSGGEPGGWFNYGTLAIGAPGEDDNAVDAGSVTLIGNEQIKVVHQDSPGIPGSQEKGDRFGYSVTLLRDVLVVGVPYESIGSVAGAGLAQVMTVRRSDVPNPDWPKPQPMVNLDQGTPGVSGTPETGDHFGWSVSLATAEGEIDTRYDLTVGVPDESIGSVPRGGGVQAFELDDPFDDRSPDWAEHLSTNQDKPGVPGVVEEGDRFGSSVDAVKGVYGLVHTVGSDGEFTDAEIGRSRSAIHVFSGEVFGAVWVRAGLCNIPADEVLRTNHLSVDGTHLYVAASGDERILGVPWRNILFGTSDPLVVLIA